MATNQDNTNDLTDATNANVAKGSDKKKIAGLGIVVGLIIVAGLVVFSLSKKSTDVDTSTPPPTMPQTPPATSPEIGETPPPTSAQKPPATVNPNQPVAAGSAHSGDTNWVKGIKKPLPVPDDLEATPGLVGSDMPQVQVVPRSAVASSAPANSKDAAMQSLWKSGAAAKQRGDNAAARKDWKRILELDPGHAGIQEAINKLHK